MHTLDGVADQLLRDVQEESAILLKKGNNTKLSGQAAVYGMAQAIPDRSLIGEFAKAYMDGYYCTNWDKYKAISDRKEDQANGKNGKK